MAELVELFEETDSFCDVMFPIEETDWDNLNWSTENSIYLLND